MPLMWNNVSKAQEIHCLEMGRFFDFDNKTKFIKCWNIKTYVVELRVSDTFSLSIHKLYYSFLLVIQRYWEVELLLVTQTYLESVTFQTAILSFNFSYLIMWVILKG